MTDTTASMTDSTVVIRSRSEHLRDYFAELWGYRALYPMLLRELTMRKFRNTMFGVWWIVIRPLIPTVMAVVSFTFVVKLDTKGVPYPIFYFAGFLVWTMFQSTMQFMPRTMTWMRGIMRKFYFPKLLIPLASIVPPLLELLVVLAMFLLTLAILYFKEGVFYVHFSWRLLLELPCLLMAFVLALSLGMISSVLALYLRDIIFTVGYVTQLWLIATPVFYPIHNLPEKIRLLMFGFNPMAALAETSRWALTGQGDFPGLWLLLSFLEIGLIATCCTLFFIRAERFLGDTV